MPAYLDHIDAIFLALEIAFPLLGMAVRKFKPVKRKNYRQDFV